MPESLPAAPPRTFHPVAPATALALHGVVHDGAEVVDQDFRGSQFVDVGAKESRFVGCRFDSCLFERAYFRKAKFTRCIFTGARFRDCNFRDAEFQECTFDYATFADTLIPSAPLLASLPAFANVRQELARGLRLNFAAIGMPGDAQRFFDVEMEAEEEFLRKAYEAREAYYAKHFPGIANHVRYWVRLRIHQFSGLLWGHGESPTRLVLTGAVGLFLMFLLVLSAGGGIGGMGSSSANPWGYLGDCLYYTLLTFFGATYTFHPDTVWARIVTLADLAFGYTMLGLLVATLFRRLARR